MTDKITITRGLVELKLLDKRILKETEMGVFVSSKINSEKNTSHQMSVEETDKKIKSSLQSINDLIKRRGEIKKAIITSNAKTNVKIGGKPFTVAEAIDSKVSIEYKKNLLSQMKGQLASILNNLEVHNSSREANLQANLQNLMNADNANKEAIDQTIKTLREHGEITLFDPIKIRDKIETLENEIDRFEADVDLCLSEINAITYIEI